MLSSAQQCDDEELPQPAARDWSSVRRHRRSLSALAGLGLIGAVIISVHSSGDGGTHHEAAPPPTRSSGPTVAANDLAGQGITVHLQQASRAPSLLSDAGFAVACPEDQTCEITLAPTKTLAAAVRAAFPGAYLGAGTNSVTVPRRALLSRTVHGTDGVREITVQIAVGTGPRDSGYVGTGTNRLSYVQRPLAGYLVRVSVTGRANKGDALAPLRRLAADPRLLAIR